MQRITNISQLNQGDMIWNISNGIELRMMKFLCVHPNNGEYSLFLNLNEDGMPKFYNKRLENSKWYLYDKDSTKDIALEKMKTLEMRLENLKTDYNQDYK